VWKIIIEWDKDYSIGWINNLIFDSNIESCSIYSKQWAFNATSFWLSYGWWTTLIFNKDCYIYWQNCLFYMIANTSWVWKIILQWSTIMYITWNCNNSFKIENNCAISIWKNTGTWSVWNNIIENHWSIIFLWNKTHVQWTDFWIITWDWTCSIWSLSYNAHVVFYWENDFSLWEEYAVQVYNWSIRWTWTINWWIFFYQDQVIWKSNSTETWTLTTWHIEFLNRMRFYVSCDWDSIYNLFINWDLTTYDDDNIFEIWVVWTLNIWTYKIIEITWECTWINIYSYSNTTGKQISFGWVWKILYMTAS
jgi:hypothetical protein